jgi:predicted secreted hydrolase
LLHGDNGYSRKGPQATSASYYYSLPQLRASGRVVIDGRAHRVQGSAWFDHEWASALMDEPARGWDWVGLNLEDGSALMVSRMRDEHGQAYWAAASERAAGATQARSYAPEQIEWTPVRHWRSARTAIRYPVEWSIKVGERILRLQPLMDDQENDSRASTGTIYWEGAVRALDENGRLIGRGYLELTGYGERMAL